MDVKYIKMFLRYRFMVVLAIVAVSILGIYKYSKLPVDAFPDISPIMVPVFAEAHGMSPEEVERLITFPIESKMNGLPGVIQIKSTSAFGMAVIYVYFNDDTDIYFARQIVGERLTNAMSDLPDMHEPPKLGPISTGLGQIFMYYLTIEDDAETDGKPADIYLREVNDWVVKYQLQTVPGVTEILSIGGHVLQYQIKVDPYALSEYRISLEELVEAVQENNRNAGGQFMLIGKEEYLVRGIGLVRDLDQIKNIHVKTVEGTPIRVGQLAQVDYGAEIRRGVVSLNGEKEVVSGIVMQLFGENTSAVIERLYEKVPEVQASLPDGVHLVPYYEQATLVEQATWTVKKSLLIGAGLVFCALVFFLGNIRTAVIVAMALPVCALVSIIVMSYGGVSANLMSLGGIAIAIGMLGDGSIVMVENIFRRLNAKPTTSYQEKTAVILKAAGEVARPIIFSVTIIIIVFLPIFTLENIEGKMFSPMAFTLTFALFGSILMAVIGAPVICTYLLNKSNHRELFPLEYVKSLYRPVLSWSVNNRKKVAACAVSLMIISFSFVPFLGTEFIPTLEEGSIFIGVNMAPSISLEEGTKVIQKLERKVAVFHEVKEIVSRIGRPEAGSHPHPVNYGEIHIELKPMKEWKDFKNKGQLVNALNKELSTYPGVQLNFTQPIQHAFDELLSGIKAQLAIKVFGEDLDIIRENAELIHKAISDIPGLVDLSVEQSFGQPQIQVIADREACARYGINVSDILELVELAVGGEVIDNVYLGTRRFGIHVRYQEKFRDDPEAISNLLVHTENGALVPLKQVADIKTVIGPIQINREHNQRRWIIQGNIRDRDLGSVVAQIKKTIKNEVDLPPGVYVEYGGQFENQQRAMGRLSVIVPVVIILVLFLLGLTYGSWRMALLVFLTIPLSLIGGIFGLYVTGEYLSVPAAVGFIALFGIGIQNGMVLVSCINQLRNEGRPLDEAVTEGALTRLRPVLMTAATTVLGLLPLLLATGIGSAVQKPLATVVIFGLFSATFSTLILIPALYSWFER